MRMMYQVGLFEWKQKSIMGMSNTVEENVGEVDEMTRPDKERQSQLSRRGR